MRTKSRKRVKKSGIIYFAINNRISGIVKMGMTTDSAEARLKTANRKHEFMCGTWTINQKVKTNDVKRTEELAHTIFANFHDKESVSSEMYFVPDGMTVKNMADQVRDKDKIVLEQGIKREKVLKELLKAQGKLEEIDSKTTEMIALTDMPSPNADNGDDGDV